LNQVLRNMSSSLPEGQAWTPVRFLGL
jgi:hypothetical protein